MWALFKLNISKNNIHTLGKLEICNVWHFNIVNAQLYVIDSEFWINSSKVANCTQTLHIFLYQQICHLQHCGFILYPAFSLPVNICLYTKIGAMINKCVSCVKRGFALCDGVRRVCLWIECLCKVCKGGVGYTSRW